MAHDVFISYARVSAASAATALRDALAKRGRAVFLDQREIDWGDPFPHEIARGIGEARLAVVFADETYFERPWCAFEFAVIVAPYRAGDSGGPLDHVVVALPPEGDVARTIDHLPPPLAQRSWPKASEIDAIVATVEARLAVPSGDIAARLQGVLDDTLARLFAGGQVPTAKPPRRSAAGAAPTRGNRSRHVPESRHDGFIGRERDLWRAFEALVTQRAFGAPRWCAIEGPGGTGKSQLAAELVWRYADRWFPGGVVWIDGDADDEAVVEQFREVLASYAPDAIDPSQHVSQPEDQLALLARTLRDVFAQHAAEARTLWVIDNVPEAGPARPGREIDRLCPARDAVDVLCTSRRTGLQPIDAHVPLTWLPTQAALELLTRPPIDPAWLSAEEWREVLDWVGGLALALQVVRASLADGFTTAKALVQATRDEPAATLDHTMDAMRGEVDERELRSIADVFEFSYRALAGPPDCRHAAQLLAQLPPVALRETLLAQLVPTALVGRLSKRSWIRATSGAERGWSMHRITASFLRGRSTDTDGEFSEVVDWVRRLVAAPESTPQLRELGWLARAAFVAFARRRRGTSHDLPRTVEAIQALATQSWNDELRGFRFVAADLANGLGAGDDLVRRFEQAYETGDEAIARALPHALQPLTASTRASALMARILDDPRDGPRWQALIHASSLPSMDLGEKQLTAILREPNGNVRDTAITAFDFFLDAGNPGLRSLISRLCELLASGKDVERAAAARLLGRVLVVHGNRLSAGGFTSAQLVGTLVHWALQDTDPEVAATCASAAGTHFDATAHGAIVRAGREATAPDARHRAALVLVEYLDAVSAPPPPRLHMVEREQGFEIAGDPFPDPQATPSAAYEPLVEVVEAGDNELARRAVERLFGSPSSAAAWSDVCDRWLAEAAFERLRSLADRVLAVAPGNSSAHWRRALALEGLGATEAAVEDCSRVIALTPQFVDAREKRGVLRLRLRQFAPALEDLDTVAAADPRSFTVHHLSSLCLYNLSRFNEAEAAASHAIELHPEVGEAWFFRGLARAAAQRPREALRDLQRAVELDPGDERAVQFKSALEAALSEGPTARPRIT